MFSRKLAVLVGGLSMACGASQQQTVAPVAVERAPASCAGGNATSDVELQRFAHCAEIRGNLWVSNVSTLEPLAGLHAVRGDLTIEGTTELESLSGLERLGSVERLVLKANQSLSDITALSRLHDVSTIDVVENPELRHLHGLAGVKTLDRLRLKDNGLQTTCGLEHLKSVRSLVIADNQRLISLAALNGVAEVAELVVTHNPRLSGYHGLFNGVRTAPRAAKFSGNLGLSATEQARFQASGPAADVASR